jgi:hypothetical protein
MGTWLWIQPSGRGEGQCTVASFAVAMHTVQYSGPVEVLTERGYGHLYPGTSWAPCMHSRPLSPSALVPRLSICPICPKIAFLAKMCTFGMYRGASTANTNTTNLVLLTLTLLTLPTTTTNHSSLTPPLACTSPHNSHRYCT